MTQLDTVVITVDPARRLRDALGIERFSVRPTRIDGRRLRAAGLDQKLRLSAMVLDVKRTWDGLVGRFVKDPGARRTIMENSFYRNLTEQFAGAEAYAALEQLYDRPAADARPRVWRLPLRHMRSNYPGLRLTWCVCSILPPRDGFFCRMRRQAKA